MKTIITILLLAATPIYAAVDKCEAIGGLAEAVMIKRQQGYKMSNLMQVAQSFDDKASRDLTKALIVEAYKTPQYNGADFKNNAVRQFRNLVELECYK